MNKKSRPVIPEPWWPIPVIIVVALWLGLMSYGGFIIAQCIYIFR